jgi:hypothetical protein
MIGHPADDPPREPVDHEGHVHEPAPGRHGRRVRDPQPIRARRRELARDQVPWPGGGGGRAEAASRPCAPRRPLGAPATPGQCVRPSLVGIVHRRGHRQDRADRLDPVHPAVGVDERHHHCARRSSSARAKSADAFRRISFARVHLGVLALEPGQPRPFLRRQSGAAGPHPAGPAASSCATSPPPGPLPHFRGEPAWSRHALHPLEAWSLRERRRGPVGGYDSLAAP